MREGEEGIDNKEVLLREVCTMNNSMVLPKIEGEPACINPCVDVIQRKRDVRLNLHVRGGKRKEMLTLIRIATEHKP